MSSPSTDQSAPSAGATRRGECDSGIAPARRASLGRLLWRAVRLRCPSCGRAKLFRGWFTMHATCGHCGRRFDRAAGYFLGAIYFNYGVTASLVVVAFFSVYFSEWLTSEQLLALLLVFAVVFPAWFFRYARSAWMAFDERWDPWPNEAEARELGREQPANSTAK